MFNISPFRRLHNPVRTLGLWSAILCTVFSLTYIIAQLGEWAGLLGSAGGPHSRSTTLGLIVLLTPSLLLGVSFVVLMVSIHYICRSLRTNLEPCRRGLRVDVCHAEPCVGLEKAP